MLAIFAAARFPRPLLADINAIWNGSTGNWSAADWGIGSDYPDAIAHPGNVYDVSIGSGSVTLNVSPEINSLLLSGGGIGGSGNLLIDHGFTWSGGVLGGGGTITTSGLVIPDAGGLNVSMSGTESLINTGTASWTTGNNGNYFVTLSPGNVFTNLGTFTVIDNAGSVFWSGGEFNNPGVLNKTGSTNLTISSLFNNSGTVNVSDATLTLSGGGAHSGFFSVAPGALLLFNGAANIFNAGATFASGSFLFTGNDTATFGNGSNVSGATLTESSGSVTFGATAAMAVGALNLSGGVVQGSANITNGMTWSAGTIQGGGTITTSGLVIPDAGGLNVSMSGTESLINTGTASWTTGNNGNYFVTLSPGNVFTNLGTFTVIDNAGSVFWSGGEFNNPGVLNKTGSTNLTISSLFNNSGTVNVSDATLTLSGGGAHSGHFGVAPGADLFFGGVNFFNSGAVLGPGNFTFTSGETAIFNPGSSITSGTLNLIGGSVTLATSVTVLGLNVNGGTFNVASSTLIDEPLSSKSSEISNLQSLAQRGQNGGTWTGQGITSSTVAADAATATVHTYHTVVAILDNGALPVSERFTSFAGQPVDANSIIVTRALAGDANLDGTVNNTDLVALLTHFGESGQTQATGDYNGDGTVNNTDLVALLTDYGQSLPGSFSLEPGDTRETPGLEGAAPVPEAGALALLLSGLPLLMRKRRRASP